ncbi:MAG: hypothetical protein JWP44_2631 [Mucilaginibacter sp.]|nr:hypothetical protein [Mucilaginibacter sp.]
MSKSENVKAYLNSINKEFNEGDHPEAYAALPDASLEFLVELCKAQGIQKVFEFGSGRSTKAFLNAGCSVVSIEDSEFWMNETLKTLNDEEKVKLQPFIRPLKTRFLGAFLVKDWEIDDELLKHLQEAELILIDSPYYTPFRESTLWSSLTLGNEAFVILDDTRIPTLNRFCDRIAKANKSLLHKRIKVGHGLDIFYRDGNSTNSFSLDHSFSDVVKGWNRFYKGCKFYSDLKKG